MKKNLIIFLIFIFVSSNIMIIHSIPKPKKNTGAIIGRVYINLLEGWDYQFIHLVKGNYYKGTVIIINNDTGKKYEILSDLEGFFSLLNISPGKYTISKFNYKYVGSSGSYMYLNTGFNRNQIKIIEVLPNSIAVINTIVINKEIVDEKKMTTSSQFTININSDVKRINESDIIINNFKQKDKKNLWSAFEYVVQNNN